MCIRDSDEDEEQPTDKPEVVLPGGGIVEWDEKEGEWVIVSGDDEEEFFSWDDIQESGIITTDGKEYSYDSEEKEWVNVNDPNDQMTDEAMQNAVKPGENVMEPNPDGTPLS